MSSALLVVGLLLSCVALLIALYRWVFALAYVLRKPHAADAPCGSARRTRFVVLIPAHNEELLIEAAVDAVRRAHYPAQALRVRVIADNCSDRTAELARARGAEVLERTDPSERGKGAALAYAIARLEPEQCDAVAVLDADVLVGPGFFAAMERELQRGAQVLQGYDGISNPDENMLTRLMAVTIELKNLLYNAGKSALGFSPLLQGTGMVFASELLKARGWRARGLSEDIEESLRWIGDGYRIHSVADARIHAQEAASLRQARSQRERWVGGVQQLQGKARRLLVRALARRDWVTAEAALGVMLPSYSKHMNLTLLAAALVAAAQLLAGAAYGAWVWIPAGLALALQLAEFGMGLALMRASWRDCASIALAPVFLLWRAALDLRIALGLCSAQGTSPWVRTERNSRS